METETNSDRKRLRSAEIIVCASKNGVIGNKGKLPWNIPEERKQFKEYIKDAIVICGRKTYEEIKDFDLTSKQIWVISNSLAPYRNSEYNDKNKQWHVYMNSWGIFNDYNERAYSYGQFNNKRIVIGGGSIYKQAFNNVHITKIRCTLLNGLYKGDTYFSIPTEYNIEEREFYNYGTVVTWTKGYTIDHKYAILKWANPDIDEYSYLENFRETYALMGDKTPEGNFVNVT